jgi:hypothetical protein
MAELDEPETLGKWKRRRGQIYKEDYSDDEESHGSSGSEKEGQNLSDQGDEVWAAPLGEDFDLPVSLTFCCTSFSVYM